MPLIWWPVVSPTQGSRFANVPFAKTRTSHVVPLRSETSVAHVHAWFSQPSYKKVRCACVYLFLSATDQAKAVRELTSEVGEQDVGETPRRRNDRKPFNWYCLFIFVLFQTTRLGGNWRLPTHQSQHDGTGSGIKADHFQSWTFAEAFNTGASSFYRKLIWFIY